jgi:alpha-glucosidase (family GH31 glycosyl hydrolase)
VPTGPVTQYIDERRDAPPTILVYPGANGSFSLYEDDGRSTAYKTGGYSRIPISYEDRTGAVRFGKRKGGDWTECRRRASCACNGWSQDNQPRMTRMMRKSPTPVSRSSW